MQQEVKLFELFSAGARFIRPLSVESTSNVTFNVGLVVKSPWLFQIDAQSLLSKQLET